MGADMRFDIHTYSDVFKHTQLFNINQLQHFIWLRIPSELAVRSFLFQVDEVKQTGLVSVDMENAIHRDCRRIWLRVTTDKLNLDSGQHTYKFRFVNQENEDISDLYFSYIIQNDNPDRSYIFMNRSDNDTPPPVDFGEPDSCFLTCSDSCNKCTL